MNLFASKTTIIAWLFTFSVSLSVIIIYTDSAGGGRLAPPAVVLAVLVVALAATLVVVAARATMMTWITVLVLLAFAGKRRRVLVHEGRKISSDVVMYLVRVVLEERGLAAVACAMVVGLMAMARVLEAMHL